MPISRYFAVAVIFTLISCKTEKKKGEDKEEAVAETSILEKVGHAHGYENWKSVEEIKFTFNVDRDSTHFERSWTWLPKTNEVTSISGSDTLHYDRKKMDSIAQKVNGGFINDRYWLFAPFNLIWDADNLEYAHSKTALAPISNEPMQRLTIIYGNEGGYTPGDAYDFYFKDDFLIREWVFRKSNQTEPSMVTTWENYVEKNGLKLALDHKKPEEDFNLYFTAVQLDMKE